MAKINRITRSGSSLVTLAELQSGSQLFTKTVINKTQITPELRDNNVLVKRAELVRRVIDRIVYSDTVSGVQVFAEYLLPVDSPLLLFIRGRFFDDAVSVTDDDAFLVPGKGFNEFVQATDDRLRLLIRAFRVFEDAALMQSRTALRLDKPLPTDLVSARDLPSLEPGLNIFDSLLATDVSRILVTFGRLFQHAVQITDLESFDIGKALFDETSAQEDPVFSLSKVLADAVAEIDNVALRAELLKQDSIAFADRTTLSSLLGKFDDVVTLDQLFKAVSITKADAVIIQDQTSRIPGKGLADQTDFADRLIQDIVKNLADFVVPQDLAGVFDGITYSYGLSRSFEVFATDNFRSATNYFRTLDPDFVSLLDIARLSLGFGLPNNVDVVIASDQKQLFIGQGIRDVQTLQDELIRTTVTSRVFEDAELSEDRTALRLNKFAAADSVEFLDVILAVVFKLVNLADAQTIQDASQLGIGLTKFEDQITEDQTSKLLNKVLSDANDLQDFSRLAVVKNLADTAITEDLAGVFDGITYNYGLNKTDDTLSTDVFSRLFNAQRVFEDDEIIDDVFSKIFNRFFLVEDALDQPADLISLQPGLSFADRVGYVTVYIDSPQDLLYNRELGTNFAGSQLFSATSVTSNVAVTSSGTAASQFDGFYAPAIPSDGLGTGEPAGGNYVLFSGLGSRWLATVPLDTTTGDNVIFSFIAGNTSNGGDRPEAGENLILEYSTDLGTSFTTTATIWAGATLWPDGANWRTTSITMPVASKTSSTIWRWRQTGSPTEFGDNYALFEIYVGNRTPLTIGFIPDAEFYSLTKVLRETVEQTDSVRRAHAARRREADLIDLRTNFERVSTSVASSITAQISARLSAPTRPTIVSNTTNWYDLAALTTSVFVISRSDSSWGVRSTNTGTTWSPINFGNSVYKFASDGLVGNTSIALMSATVGPFKSTDQGASWASAAAAINVNGTQYYLPHWDNNRRIFIAFHRRSIPPSGKGSTQYSWRYDYSNNQLTTWNAGTTHIGPGGLALTGDYPAGVASGALPSGTGYTVLVNLDGQTWFLNSSVSIGTFFTNVGNDFPGWPGEISSSYLDNNFLTHGAGQFVFVYPASGGPVWRTTSLNTWFSSTLTGSAVPQGIFWDTSLSRFVVIGELSAGVPIVWTSTDADTWSSSTSTTGSVFVDNAVPIRSALVPGTTTSGTSTLVGIELNTTVSSVLRTTLFIADTSFTSFTTSVSNRPTPRGAELPSATRYDVVKSARAGQQYTINFKDTDGSTGTTSLVFTTSVATTSGQVTTSDTNIATLTTSAGVFTNSNIWASGIGIRNRGAGTGSGATGGFATYAHYFFDTATTRTLTTKSFSTGIASIAFRHIAGNGTNGGETPDLSGEQLVLQYLSSSTGTWVTATTVNLLTTDSWTLTSIALLFSPTRIRLVQFASSGGTTDNYGVAEVSLLTVTSVVTVTSVTTSTVFTGTAHPLDSSVALTYTSSDTDRVGTVDTWRRLISVNRVFEEAAPPLDAERFTLIKPISSVNIVVGFGADNFGQRVSGDDLERTAFNINKSARRSVAGSLLVKTIESLVPSQFSTSVQTIVTPYYVTLQTDGYMSSVTTGNNWTGSTLFLSTSDRFGTVSTDDFGNYFTYRTPGIFQGESRYIDSNLLDLRNATAISFDWRVSGHDGSPSFSVTIGDTTTTIFDTSSSPYSGTSYTTKTIVLTPAQRQASVLVRFRQNADDELGSSPFAAFTNFRVLNTEYSTSYETTVTVIGYTGVRDSSVLLSQSAQDRDAVGVIDLWTSITDYKRNFELETPALDRIAKLLIPATLTDTVSVEDSYSLVTDGLTYDGTKLFREIQPTADSRFFDITKSLTDQPIILDRTAKLVGLNKTDDVKAGIDIDQARGNELERLAFSITMLARADAGNPATHPVQIGFGTAAPGLRVSGDDLERTSFNFTLRAKQGANVTVSGVTVAASSTSDTLRVGQQFGIIRFSGDAQERISLNVNKAISSINIRAGSGVDQARGNVLERLVFSITKRIGDSVIPDDFLQTFDGLTYRATLLERDSLTAGIVPALGIRVTGSPLERTAFDFSLLAKQGANVTVSGVTIAASSTSDNVRVGQRYGVIRFSGDAQERIRFDISKPISSITLRAGIDYDQRSANEERSFFTVGKRISSVAVVIGFGGGTFGARVSGNDLERTSFDFSLRAKQGANVTVSGVTIAATSTTDIVRIGQRYGTIRFSGDAQERISLDFLKTPLVEISYIAAGGASGAGGARGTSLALPDPGAGGSSGANGTTSSAGGTYGGGGGGADGLGRGLGDAGVGVVHLYWKNANGTDSSITFTTSAAATTNFVTSWVSTVNGIVVAICVGGGGAGQDNGGRGGGGGGLGWAVVPVGLGNTYTVQVGRAGLFSVQNSGGDSYFSSITTVKGGGGANGIAGGTGGNYVGQGGGNGGNGGNRTATYSGGGGGGAGGYSGNGGAGGNADTGNTGVPNNDSTAGSPGSGGGAGGGGGGAYSGSLGRGAGGGGTGIVPPIIILTTQNIVISDDQRRFANYKRPVELSLSTESRFNYLLTQPRREDLLASDAVTISNLLFRTLEDTLIDPQGDLDPFGNINTMVSNGSLRMTDYVDIEYLENDYVGASRSFS